MKTQKTQQNALSRVPGAASNRGFTLIELMVTVAIVGILATIAVTSYSSQVQKSRRTDARSALLDLAGREEKLYSVTNAYSQVPSQLGYGTAAAFPVLVGNNYYNVTVVVPDTVNQPTVQESYLITATPVAGGLQANDTQCQSLTLNQLGVQGSTGSATAATCWGN
jgi:type IV pilus assembly protein PilE